MEEEYKPEREPTGFFPPASAVARTPATELEGTPMQAAYTPVAQGFIPNSVLTKLLWPQAAKEKHAEQKREEWKLPEFSPEQMEQISKLKQVGSVILLR